MKSKDYVSVLEYCNQVLSSQPSNAKALYRRGCAHYEREEWDEAERDFRQVLAQSSSAVSSPTAQAAFSLSNTSSAWTSASIVSLTQRLKTIEQKKQRAANQQRQRYNGFLLKPDMLLYEDRIKEKEQQDAEAAESATIIGQAKRYLRNLQHLTINCYRFGYEYIRSWCCQRKQRKPESEESEQSDMGTAVFNNIKREEHDEDDQEEGEEDVEDKED
jgi:hypothetical protein